MLDMPLCNVEARKSDQKDNDSELIRDNSEHLIHALPTIQGLKTVSFTFVAIFDLEPV